MNNLIELPKKWCIKVTDENHEVLSKWRTDGTLHIYNVKGYYLISYLHNRKGYCQSNIEPHYTEITFEQFKEWVLGEKPQEKLLTTIL